MSHNNDVIVTLLVLPLYKEVFRSSGPVHHRLILRMIQTFTAKVSYSTDSCCKLTADLKATSRQFM